MIESLWHWNYDTFLGMLAGIIIALCIVWIMLLNRKGQKIK